MGNDSYDEVSLNYDENYDEQNLVNLRTNDQL